ncbi:MAG TPA: plastocyanin/azurin family copper-binding protein [Archangium sp.]
MRVICVLVFLAAGARAEDVVISQKDKTFAPGEITVKKGDTLTFRNDDAVAHNVFSKGAKFNLKIQPPGEKTKVAFDEPGTHEVRCAIHPKMILKVTVKP